MSCRNFTAATQALLLGAVLFALTGLTPAAARIGETRAQLTQRYGAGTDQGAVVLYASGPYNITVYFSDDKSIMEITAKVERVAATTAATAPPASKAANLTIAEVTQLLRDNYSGGWLKLKESDADIFWRSQDPSRNGKYQARFSKNQQILTVRLLDANEMKFDKLMPMPKR